MADQHPPVVPDQWPRATEPPTRGFATIANWRGYDLAALTSGGWTEQEQEELSRAHWKQLNDPPVLCGLRSVGIMPEHGRTAGAHPVARLVRAVENARRAQP